MQRSLWIWLGLGLFALFACGWLPSPPATPAIDQVATQVAATLTAWAPPPPTPSPLPTSAPTPTATASPVHWPTGFWVGTEETHLAQLYTWPDTNIGLTVSLPSTSIVDSRYLSPVGSPANLFFALDDLSGHILLHSPTTQQAQLFATLPQGSQGNALVGLTTAPPSLWIAFSYVLYGENYTAQSGLSVGQVGQTPGEVLHLDAGYPLLPLRFSYDAQGTPQSLWATTQAFGIGDVMVAPTEGLWRIDLSTMQATSILPQSLHGAEYHILGVSPTGRRAAYFRSDDPTHVHLLDTTSGSEEGVLATVAGEMGAASIGYAAFSPDDRYVAWAEFTGAFEAGYQGHLALYDLSSAQPLSVAHPLPPSWDVFPIAWLSNHQLLLQGWDENQSLVIVWDVQGGATPLTIPGNLLGVQH